MSIFAKIQTRSTLVVQGDITTSMAHTQSFNTEIVSSSVIFASGSTRFGDTIDDSHNMTGSLFVSNITFDTNLTGSITNYSFGNLVVGGGGISSRGYTLEMMGQMLFYRWN